MGKVIAVTSGKGGVGKSTVAAGLAVGYCNRKKSVLLVDMDEGLRCLDLMFGIDDSTVFDLSDVLNGKELSDAAYEVPGFEGLRLIPAPAKYGSIGCKAFSDFVIKASGEYDTVIFDFPAGIDFSLYPYLGKQAVFITVCNPDPVSVRDTAGVCERLTPLGCKIRLVLNRFRAEVIRSGIYRNVDDIIDISGMQLLGIVPDTPELTLFAVSHRLKPRARAMKAFDRIVKRLDGEHSLLPKYNKI